METEINARQERIKAIATIAITAAVNIANVLGYALDADALVNAGLSIVSVACIVWSWWRNNNLTEAAMVGSAITAKIKGEKND